MHAAKFIALRIIRAMRNADIVPPTWAAALGERAAPEERVPLETIHELWAHAMRNGAPASFPVTTARIPLAEMQSALTFLCTSSATLGDAILRMIENWNVVSEHSRWRIEADGGNVRLALEAPAPRNLGARCHVEYLIADLVHTGRLATGNDLPGLIVCFRHGDPGGGHAELDEHRSMFGGALRWGAAQDSLEAPAALLGVSMQTAAPGLAAVLEQQVDAMRARSIPATSESQRVRDAIRALLDSGSADVRIDVVAFRLGLGPRTLSRRLRADGATYQAVLDDVRRELAHELLTRRRLSSKAVSSALGFSDARAFARAFRRWTGASPGSLKTSSKVPSLSFSDA
jgi:AraC-like DNA-binding protein